MEKHDLTRIRALLPTDPELAGLWDEHQKLEEELERLKTLRTLTPGEIQRSVELKKRKLAGRDRIQQILGRLR